MKDGERLGHVLRGLGLSQADAARNTGIHQGSLNAMVNGVRDINREDLRKLGEIGIPPDYLLGLTNEIVPPGQSRTQAQLEDDLARTVWNSLRQQPLLFVDPKRRGERATELKVSLASDADAPWWLRKHRLLPYLVNVLCTELESWLQYNARRDAVLNGALAALGTTMTGEFLQAEDVDLKREVLGAAVQRIVDSALVTEPDTQLIDGFRGPMTRTDETPS